MKLSVVIPSYNESANLKKDVLSGIQNYLDTLRISYEIIIVDDGSTDDSVDLIKNAPVKNIQLIQNQHGGKANTVMTGMLKAAGEIILFTDMDQATPINQIEKFLPKFSAKGGPSPKGYHPLDEDSGWDIVIGSRSGRRGAPLIRKLSAWGFSVLRSVILGLPFKDTQCGFKAFNKDAVNKILPKIKSEWGVVHFKGGAVNAGFDVELLYLAKKYGFRIAEVPVEWNYVDTERVQIVKDAMAAIYDMFRIRWNDLTGKYKN